MAHTVQLDDHTYGMLNKKKEEMKTYGIRHPSFSDAVRYACGLITLSEKKKE